MEMFEVGVSAMHIELDCARWVHGFVNGESSAVLARQTIHQNPIDAVDTLINVCEYDPIGECLCV